MWNTFGLHLFGYGVSMHLLNKTRSLQIVGNQVICGEGFEEEGRVVNIVYTQNAADSKLNITLVYLKKPLEGGIDAPSCADDLTPQMVSDITSTQVVVTESLDRVPGAGCGTNCVYDTSHHPLRARR